MFVSENLCMGEFFYILTNHILDYKLSYDIEN